MNAQIRKISVGKEYPDGAIHYQVGKIIRLQQVPYEIHSILINSELKQLGIVAYDVYIANEEGKVLWKTIQNMPVITENNINFD